MARRARIADSFFAKEIIMNVQIEDLTAEAFAPFGTIVEQPNRAPVAEGTGWHWWGEITYLGGGDRPYAVGRVDLEPAPLRFDWAERHMKTDEMLVPLGGECLVYVGPALYPDEPTRLPPLDQFRVFRVRPGQGVLMKAGIWHGAPMTADQPLGVLVVLLKDTGTTDVYVSRFEESPIDIVS
jgi:ureidoglycolate lyase